MDKIETVKEKNTDRTLLHIAAERGSGDIVTYLHHVCPSLRDKIDINGCNVIHFSAKCVTKGAIECLKILIDIGISPKVKNSNGESILSQAVQHGNIENVKYICELYSELLHLTDNYGNTALHDAARNGTVMCMKFLVEKGLNPTETNDDGNTILHSSASGGNIATLKYICDTYPDLVPVSDNDGLNALHSSVLNGTVDCVKFLIDKGIDPGDMISDGSTILHLSAYGGHIATLKYICDTYPDMLQGTDNDGFNALHNAAHCGTVDCVKILIDKRIDPGDRINNGGTLLHLSADGGNITTLKYICDTYPDMLPVADNAGFNALHDAAYGGTVKCVEFLIDKGIDPGDMTSDGRTILHLSANGGNIATLNYICDTYPDMLPVTDNDGFNALHDAAHGGNVKCVKFLIDKGIDPGDRTSSGKTILQLSANGGNIVTLKYICDTYPDLVPVTDNDGCNALHHIAFKGNVECVKFLIDKGIDPGDKISDGRTILHLSAYGGNIGTLKYICETYPDLLHETDHCCRNALHLALVGKGCLSCLNWLLDQNIDPEAVNDEGENILHIAIMKGNAETIQFIITKCNVLLNTVNIAIIHDLRNSAIETGNTEMAQLCLDIITEKNKKAVM